MVKSSRKIAMVKRESEKQISVTFSKRRKGLFNKAAEFSILCDSQIAVLACAPITEKKPKTTVHSFGHNSVWDVIAAFLNNSLPTINNVDPIKESNPVSLIWTDINSVGDHDEKKKNSLMLKLLEDFEYCDSVEELNKLVDDLENLVDQVKRISPNFNCETIDSDNYNGDDYLIDLRDLVSDDFNNNGDDHQLMEVLESELKNCTEKINSESDVPLELKVVSNSMESDDHEVNWNNFTNSKIGEFSFDNEYDQDTHIPFVDYWPSTP